MIEASGYLGIWNSISSLKYDGYMKERYGKWITIRLSVQAGGTHCRQSMHESPFAEFQTQYFVLEYRGAWHVLNVPAGEDVGVRIDQSRDGVLGMLVPAGRGVCV